MDSIQIVPIPALKDNYIWAIVNWRYHGVLVVDPGDASPVIRYLKQHQLHLKGILVTHHHGDHTAGIAALTQIYSVPVYGAIQSPCGDITCHIQEGDCIQIDAMFPTYRVIAIPGHTLDHLAYYADLQLFCGDTLFAGGCGRLFEGVAEQLYHSLNKLALLPKQTKVYCAHEYTLNNLRFAQLLEPHNAMITERLKKVSLLREKDQPSLPSLLMEELQTNPFLRCEVPEVIIRAQNYSNQTTKQAVDVFKIIRKWKDVF